MLTGVTLLPLILVLLTGSMRQIRHIATARIIEALALWVGLLMAGVYIFSRRHAPSVIPAGLYLPLPFLLWAAMRFGVGGIAAALSTISAL